MGKTVEYFDIDVTQKQLQVKTNIVIPSGNVNSYALRLHISGDEWDGLAPIVSFFHQERKYLVMVTDSVAVIPASVLKMRGRFCFGVFATQLDKAGNLLYRFSTNLQKGLVTDGAYSDNEAELDASDIALYEQLISQMKAVVEVLNAHAKDFDNPHEVTSEQIGTYSKAEIDAQAEVTAKALEDANSEIAAKLTKITEFYPVDRVYGVNMAGRQVMLEAHRDFNSDGGIPVYDNNGVIKTGTPAKDTDSVNKKYVDDKAAGKLDKVKSDFVFYPKVYATNSTDGTPYLMTATSNLGYIGKGSGYIATYDGGELKTGTPTSDDSAANKAYVDSEIKSLQEPYELIEEITLTETTSLVTRDKWPNGDAYSFSKIRVEVDSNAITAGFNTYVRYENDSTAHTSAIMSNAGVKYFATFDGRIENGYLTETVVNTNSRRANNAALLQSAASTPMSAIQFLKIWFNSSATLNNVGTTIRIYGVRA